MRGIDLTRLRGECKYNITFHTKNLASRLYFWYIGGSIPSSDMKKSHFLLTLLAASSSLAAALPNYPTIYSAEAGGPVPNPNYATASSSYTTSTPSPTGANLGRYALDINFGYGFKATPDNKFACDMASVELEGAYYVAPHHALTLTLSFAGGGRTDDYWTQVGGHRGEFYPFTDSYDRYSYSLMAGYRYSRMLGRYAFLQVGAKGGLDIQRLDVDYGYGWHAYPYESYKGQDDTAAGFAYAAYAYVGFFVTQSICLHVGYQFKGTTAKPTADSGYSDVPRFRGETMRWHEVRAGVTIHF